MCQSYKGNTEPQCECQSERRAALISKHMEITARSGSTCASRTEAGWWMLWRLTASRGPTHRGCCSWGMAAAGRQGSSREASDLEGCGGGCCHCWISGGGGRRGPRFSTQHSGDYSNGAQKLGLLTSAIRHKPNNSLSQKHPHTYCMHTQSTISVCNNNRFM